MSNEDILAAIAASPASELSAPEGFETFIYQPLSQEALDGLRETYSIGSHMSDEEMVGYLRRLHEQAA